MTEEKARRLGRYVVVEHTARRLVAEARGNPLLTVGTFWGAVVLVLALIAPWRGGTRLWVAVTTALVAVVIGLLLLHFVPRQERVVVDREEGVFRAERTYLLPSRSQGVQVPLAEVKGIRCRRRRRRDRPGMETTRWMVELMGEEKSWRLAEGETEGPTRELARLMAEVAGRPLVSASSG